MRKHLILALGGLLLVVASASTGRAEVKMVQMKISGYLCGN
jgi:hypothetical protein